MRKSRYTDEQVIVFIKQADAGMSVADLCRREGFSSATFYKLPARSQRLQVLPSSTCTAKMTPLRDF